MAFVEEIITDFNANDDTSNVTVSMDISTAKMVAFGVMGESGSHDEHEIALQLSFDDTKFFGAKKRLTGLGFLDNISTAAKFARCRCAKAEGSASKVKIIMQAK